MPREFRRRFFYALIALFLVGGTAVVFYAEGWRLGLNPEGGLAAEKVGGIYLHTYPYDASVTLNGKPKQRDFGIFEHGTLLSELLPGTYDLVVSAPGYQSWTQHILVKSSLVARREFVVLIPAAAAAATSVPVSDIALAGRTLVLQEGSGLTTLAGTPIPGDAFLAASEDGAVVITYASSTHAYLATTLSQATTTALKGLPARTTFQAIPGDGTLFITQNKGNLGLLRTSTGETTLIATSSILEAAVAGRVAWTEYDPATRTSLLSFYDIGSRATGHDIDSLPGKVTELVMQDANQVFALTDDGSVYSLDLGQSSRTRLAQNARGLSLSPNGDDLAVQDAQGVRIFFLRSEQPQASLALPQAAQVRGLTWYRDGEHLFVTYADHVSFLDLSDTGLEDFSTVASTPHAEYLPDANVLYFIQNGTLFATTFPSS